MAFPGVKSTTPSTSDSVGPGSVAEDGAGSQLAFSGTCGRWQAGFPVPTLIIREARPWLPPGSQDSGCSAKKPRSWHRSEGRCFHKAN